MPTNPATAFAWPFVPNWRAPFAVTREYRTDTINTRSRREQRRALRTTPRRAFEFEVLLHSADLREFNGLMALAQNKPFIMADWSRRAELSVAAILGGATLTFAAIPGWIVAGRALFLYDGAARPQPVIVASVAGNVATLTVALLGGWAAGSTVLPGAVGFLSPETTKQRVTSAVATVAVQFSVESASEPATAPPAPAVVFNGREVCLARHNWDEGASVTLNWGAEIVDFQRGAIAYAQPFTFPLETARASFLAATVAEARAFEDLFDRMKGQRGEFYLPSGENDLPPKLGLTGGSATLRIAGTNTALHYNGSAVYVAICVTLRDGSQIYRSVSGIAIDGVDSVVTVTAPWSATVALASIARIAWMPVWRFGSDAMTMEWVTGSVAQLDMALQMLEDLPAETL